jgi:hypothetical protein
MQKKIMEINGAKKTLIFDQESSSADELSDRLGPCENQDPLW